VAEVWRAAASAAAVAGGAWLARAAVPGGTGRWDRTNHRGETLSMLEGPSWAAGALAGVLAAPGLPVATRAGAALATAGAAAFGAVDDLAERGSSKGLRGHLGELIHGRLTTGGLKVLGIGATGLVSGLLLLWPAGRAQDAGGRRRALLDAVLAGGVVAGTANLTNLLDLRPGRVLKVVGLTVPVLLTGDESGPLSAAALGASAAMAGPDLAEHAMLGDCGANAAGALLGSAIVARTAALDSAGRRWRAGVLVGVVALTLASEKVSFTRVIESTPGLRELDALGRRPTTAAGAPPAFPGA
jgi:UDP-GlcNAc:undecaprenyl-phosphate/decaprenyl-phosphate GlcNAc-1-phosphate transferase